VNWGNLKLPSTEFSFHRNLGWAPGWGSSSSYDRGEGSQRVGLVYMGSGMAEGEAGGVALSSASARNVWISSATGLGVGDQDSLVGKAGM
jgi:hypothetical protein